MRTISIHFYDGPSGFAEPEDSRFAETPLVDPKDIQRRVIAAKTVAALRQVLSELETARKEDVIDIAKAYTGHKFVSAKQAIDGMWSKWYITNLES